MHGNDFFHGPDGFVRFGVLCAVSVVLAFCLLAL